MPPDKTPTTKCLICGRPESIRGLCEAHYRSFQREKKRQGTAQAMDEFDQLCIDRGLVLPKQQGGRPGSNPFREVAEVLAEAREAYERQQSKKKSRPNGAEATPAKRKRG